MNEVEAASKVEVSALKVEVAALLVEANAVSEGGTFLVEDTGPLVVVRKVSLPPLLVPYDSVLESCPEFVREEARRLAGREELGATDGNVVVKVADAVDICDD